ncbi:MAG: hypothetical protein RLZZ330_1240 [Actinomycetota bacterium]
MGWRFLIATVVIILLKPKALKMSWDVFRKGVYIGLALGLGFLVQTYGLMFTSATVSGFITGMFVVLTPIAAGVVYKIKVPAVGWIGVGLAVLGLAALSLKGWSFGMGESWTLLGAVFFSFQIMWLSRWATTETSYSITIVQIAVTAVLFLSSGLVMDGYQVPPNQGVWVAILFLAVFASAIAFSIQTWSQSHMDPTRAAVILSFEPVFAGIFGVWVAGDAFTWRVALGGALILGAMYLVELGPKHNDEVTKDLSNPHLGI